MGEGQAKSLSSDGAHSGGRWLVYLRLGRVSNLPTVWTNAMAGVVLAGGSPEPESLAWLAAALSLFYIGGMFLNDAFDADFDRQFRPERPIPAGQISRRDVFLIGFALLAAGEVLLALPLLLADGPSLIGGNAPFIPVLMGGLALATTIVYYDFRHKNDPLSPFVMGLCRGWVYFISAATVASPFSLPVVSGFAVLLCYMIGLTYAAKQENLRQVRNLWPLLFLLAPFAYGAPVLMRLAPESGLFILLLGWVLYAVSFLVRKEGRNIGRAVVSLLAGICLLDALLVAGASDPTIFWLLPALGAFALTLYLQRFVPGT
jgi:hypothetical protein